MNRGTRPAGHRLALALLTAALGACAAVPQDRVVLLPGPDGRVGAVAVNPGDAETVLASMESLSSELSLLQAITGADSANGSDNSSDIGAANLAPAGGSIIDNWLGASDLYDAHIERSSNSMGVSAWIGRGSATILMTFPGWALTSKVVVRGAR